MVDAWPLARLAAVLRFEAWVLTDFLAEGLGATDLPPLEAADEVFLAVGLGVEPPDLTRWERVVLPELVLDLAIRAIPTENETL